MPQMFALLAPLVFRVTHDWPRFPQRQTRVWIDASNNVRQIRREDGHFVARRLQLTDDVRVPSTSECHVRIGLHGVIFSTAGR